MTARSLFFITTTILLVNACSILPSGTLSLSAKKTSESGPAYDPDCVTNTEQLLNFEPAGDDSLWGRVRSNYQLQNHYNPRMDRYIAYYSSHQKYLDRVSTRANRYMHYIVSELEKRDMPMELALLPIIESAYDPFAYSHGRASGIWQFIPGTGRAYGLKQNWWYDGRRDIVASTDAALNYLERLAKRFDGDYLLALAAYNSGGGNVNKAIKRNKKAGKPTDFWSLKLPKETRAYVPQLLSLSRVIADPAAYQINLKTIPNSPYFKKIDTHSQIDLAQAAELACIEMDELHLLNPGFNRWATAPKGPHRLLIPIEKSQQFAQNLAALPKDLRIGWQRYTIKSGDSLIKISNKFNTSVGLLKDINHIRGSSIRQGKTLLIPIASRPEQYYAYSAAQRLKTKQRRSKGKAGTTKIRYQVHPGDSFWKISRQFSVSVSSLAKWNGMAPKDPLKSGQKLLIWTKKPELAAYSNHTHSNYKNKKGPIRKVNYRVRNGDSLAKIAGKFNLSINDIRRWNPSSRSSKYIQPGQSLKLFVDVTRVN